MPHVVAILGRPNVGKSTLFNRLVGAQKAIVENVPGVTRDRHYDLAEWCGHQFTVVDTGGYLEGVDSPIDKAVVEQVEIAIEEATLLLFLVDCKAGVHPQDEAIAALVRQSAKPCLLVVNKVDTHTDLMAVPAFHRLGIKEVYPIAAVSGSGTGDLLDKVVECLPSTSPPDPTSFPKLAFIGRPNVGKSTFINSFLGTTRSIVSETAGTTRAPVDSYYQAYNKKLLLIDTAGIRKKKQVQPGSIEFYSLIRTVKAIERADVCLVLINASEGITTQDKNILSLVHRRKKGVVLLVNKWDELPKGAHTPEEYIKRLRQQLGYMDYIPILFTSGLYKKGLYQTVEKAVEVYENRQRPLPTAKLNNALLKAVAYQQPPLVKGKAVTLKYATSLPTAGVTIAIFSNLPQEVPTSYKRYLEKQFRHYFPLEGVPVAIVFRQK